MNYIGLAIPQPSLKGLFWFCQSIRAKFSVQDKLYVLESGLSIHKTPIKTIRGVLPCPPCKERYAEGLIYNWNVGSSRSNFQMVQIYN